MNRLEPGQLWLMRIHALIAAAIIAMAVLAAETILAPKLGLVRGALFLPLMPILAYAVLVSPGRRYSAWSYGMDEDELQLRHGVWTQVQTIVPLERVQHIDLSQGPLERAFNVCRLIVHTAGTQHSRIVLPGLSRAMAEQMRDEIRTRIRQDGG